MTATVDGALSPYFHSLPDMCKRIPDSAVAAAGFDVNLGRQPLQYKEASSIVQSCSFNAADPDNGDLILTGGAGIAVTNINDLLNQGIIHVVQKNIPIGPHQGYTYTSPAQGQLECHLAYGTFFGTALFGAAQKRPSTSQPCDEVTKVARALYPYIPTRPSEMAHS
ncbi:hypothetical protein GCM10027169_28210 [Gordonia jinhuaensis]|uniref:Uncharacterized protein n=1 Tax=Gordonia jinhuaensis TaxID=1517702 RepID=A0A916TAC4_9ACTN|nr:hypothetical protein GCM10011489_25920 [Gordonia jinhuaensis]